VHLEGGRSGLGSGPGKRVRRAATALGVGEEGARPQLIGFRVRARGRGRSTWAERENRASRAAARGRVTATVDLAPCAIGRRPVRLVDEAAGKGDEVGGPGGSVVGHGDARKDRGRQHELTKRKLRGRSRIVKKSDHTGVLDLIGRSLPPILRGRTLWPGTPVHDALADEPAGGQRSMGVGQRTLLGLSPKACLR
jgi:hypothetical protein